MTNTANNKKLAVPLTIFAILVLFFIFSKANHPKTAKIENKPAATPSLFGPGLVDGHSWQKISTLNITEEEKIQLKASLIKISLETSIINGTPLIEPKGTILEYSAYIDNFYNDPNNLNIPVFFSVKIADMIKSGNPEIAVQAYKAAILQKLSGLGLIKSDQLK